MVLSLITFTVHQRAHAQRPPCQSPRPAKGHFGRRRPGHSVSMTLEIRQDHLSKRASAGLIEPAYAVLRLYRYPVSRAPRYTVIRQVHASRDIRLESTVKDSSQESLREGLSDPALKDDSDADTLVDADCGFVTQATRPNTICYRHINLFLLRNPDNPEQDILMAEVDFQNLKGRPEGTDG
jgi:hypothetical protein